MNDSVKPTKSFLSEVFSRNFCVGVTQTALVVTMLYTIPAVVRAASR